MANGATLGTAYVQIVPSAQGISGSLSGMLGGEAAIAGKSAGVALGGSLVTAIGGVIAAAGIGKLVTDSITAGMDFDSAMSQVAATMGVATSEIQNLRDFAKEMGATTAFSATEAAEALNYMALAGYDAETSMSMLPNVLNLAAAGGIELASASDMVTDAQTALGLSLDETSVMVDQMAKTASKSNTSVAQLGDAFLQIGANARKVSGGTEELSTVLGVLADNGIKGAEAGTHLRNIMLAMNPTTDKAVAAWKELGVSAYDAEGNLRRLPNIFQDLNKAMEGMTDQEKTDMFTAMFNKTDLASIQALVGTTSDRFKELSLAIDGAWYSSDSLNTELDSVGLSLSNMETDLSKFGISAQDISNSLDVSGGSAEEFVSYLHEFSSTGASANEILAAMGTDLETLQTAFDNTTGAAQQMADTQLDNLEGDITLLKSALEGVQIALSEQVMPGLRDLAQGGQTFLSDLATNIQSGDWGAVGESVKTGFKTALDTAFQAVTNALNFVTDNAETIAQTATEFLTTITHSIAENVPELLPAAADAILTTLGELLDDPTKLGEEGEILLNGILDGIINAEAIFGEKAPMIITKLGEALVLNAPKLVNVGGYIADYMWQGITEKLINGAAAGGSPFDIVTPIVAEVQSHAEELKNAGRELLAFFTGGVSENIIDLAEVGGMFVSTLSQVLATKIVEMIPPEGQEMILSFIKGVNDKLNTLTDIPRQMIQLIASGLRSFGSLVETAALELVTKIKAKFDAGGWPNVGRAIINGIAKGIQAAGSTLITTILSMCQSALGAVKKFFGIASPSKVMANEVGRYIPEGIAVGIEKYSSSVTDAMDDLKTDAMDAASSLSMSPRVEGSSQTDINGILARMDAMLSLMERYYPEMSESNGTVSISAINRQLGAAYS